MTLLRSRETSKLNKDFLQTLENGAMEPATPSKSLETSSQPLANVTPLSSRVAPRRSLRLASKTGLTEIASQNGNIKDFEVDNGPTRESLKSLVGVENSVLDEDKGLGVLLSEGVEKVDLNDSDDIGNSTNVYVKKGKGKNRASMEVQGEGQTKYLSLRSGKKISKRAVEESSGGSVGESESVQNGYAEKLSGGKLIEGISNKCDSDEPSSVKRRRFSREEKGKATAPEQGLSVVHTVKLETEVKFGISLEPIDQDGAQAAALRNGDSKDRRRLSREEKGKTVMADNDLPCGVDTVDRTSKPEVENVIDVKVSRATSFSEDITIHDAVPGTNVSVTARRRGYKERFRDIARQNASRFAHFSSQAEQDVYFTNEAAEEIPREEMGSEKIEDWPGPFATAMKIIRDRETNIKNQQQTSSFERSKIDLLWVPKKEQQCRSRRLAVPSLQDLCMAILIKNADAIISLDSVPDVLRHKICQSLCDSRKMTNQFFELLARGSPTEIRIRDCSWLDEENFTQTFEGCDTSNLAVLQLDQCGRCMPDYILLATLACCPNNLPVLTTLSLKGACRLSDAGLKAIISAAPRLRSMNLSQCSLLTCDGISYLANSLGSVLRELYLDDCEAIDPMLILPELLKLEHLEVLSVAGIQTICDSFIKEFVTHRGQSLREIVLKGCTELTDCSLKEIAQNCPGLRAIDLSNLHKLTDSAIGHLATGCRVLDKLKLCRNAFSDEAVAAFVETSGESLKELSLNCVNKIFFAFISGPPMSHNTATSLAKCSKNLISLDLSWCRNLTNEALGLIVDNCLSLEVLKLFGCTQVTSVFLDGHSNHKVQIIGLKMTPILQHIETPDPLQQGPLRYSAPPSLL